VPGLQPFARRQVADTEFTIEKFIAIFGDANAESGYLPYTHPILQIGEQIVHLHTSANSRVIMGKPQLTRYSTSRTNIAFVPVTASLIMQRLSSLFGRIARHQPEPETPNR
jgi:hypothetical protein